MKTIILLATVFILILCLVACRQAKSAELSVTTDDTASVSDILSLTDKNTLVISLKEHLDEKTHYGENVSVLSEAERTFYITQTLEMEVNNGGFSQFFYNPSGNFSNELVEAFTAIGADKTAAICRRAVNAFGCDIPVDRSEREEMLDNLESDEHIEILNECDNEFYAYEDNLEELNYNFVMKNKEQFS